MVRQTLATALAIATIAARVRADQVVLSDNHKANSTLNDLATRVNGRLHTGKPFASSCFLGESNFDSETCSKVQAGYLDELSRSKYYSAQIQPQWEGCQRKSQQCLLDWTNPKNDNATKAPYTCSLGSISDFFIDVRSPEDVQHAFHFSRMHKVPLIVKNTGHDYKGRSSAPGTLALWTHNMKEITLNEHFVPEGCDDCKAKPAVTMQAGVQWKDAYGFAEENNVTIVGGSDVGVGAVGGWLQGGGHGMLTNTYGMGIDRVLQFKVVTPDGEYRVVNKVQNPDLFWALRGGGGGTFGVVMEATVLVEPQLALQVTVVTWKNTDKAASTAYTREMFGILIDNALKWTAEGYGGLVWPETVIYLTPTLDQDAAAKTMAPLLEFGNKLKAAGVTGATVIQHEFPSWLKFYNTFAGDNGAKVGIPLALASRLVQRESFATAEKRAELLDAFMRVHATTPLFRLLLGPPSSFPGETGATSINPAWRNSIFHATLVATFNYNSTLAEKEEVYTRASRSIDHIRAITPNASYSNEADIFEPDHEDAFWGDNYPELLRIKKQYDPHHLLDCWHCVGWNRHSSRFSCYPEKQRLVHEDL